MKIDYMLRVFRLGSFLTLFKLAKKISKKINKNFIFVLLDMIICSFKYGASFHDYQEFEFYLLNNKERKTYLTRSKNNTIIKKLNNKNYYEIFNNKYLFVKKFKKYLKRETLNLNEVTKKEFEEFIQNKSKIICKPYKGTGGKGIKIYDLKKIDSNKLYNELISGDFLLEEVIIQHDKMSKLYDRSVNSIRIFTFQNNGKSYFLHAVLKIGNGGIVDNFSSGGMYAFLSDDGKVISKAIDEYDNSYEIHPKTKEKIVGFEVPYFKETIQLVKEASLEVKEIGYVGWDIAISKNGPVLIEGNCYPGIFQKRPSESKIKVGLIPKYEKIMKFKIK